MLSQEISLDTYALRISDMHPSLVPSLHELSLSVRWPHREEDWADMLRIGHGLVAKDPLNRLICSMMWFPMGNNYASVGMGISSPRLQSKGAGRWLAEHIQHTLDGRNVFLNATKDSLRLCLSFNFDIAQPVFHYNGVIEVSPTPPSYATSMLASDVNEIIRLDTAAMGFSRERIIKHLCNLSTGTVIKHEGSMKGFALCRRFGRGHTLGPIVAESEYDAIALIAPLIQALNKRFVRLDIYQDTGILNEYLATVGLKHHETVTKMTRGNMPNPQGRVKTLALASQALG